MHLRTGGDYVEFVLEHARHRGDFQGGITGGDCCTYYLSDLLHISLIISIFVLYLKAF